MARLREAAGLWEFRKLKTVTDPEAYMIPLRLVAGLQNSEPENKLLEYLQIIPEATIDKILLVIHQRKQTI